MFLIRAVTFRWDVQCDSDGAKSTRIEGWIAGEAEEKTVEHENDEEAEKKTVKHENEDWDKEERILLGQITASDRIKRGRQRADRMESISSRSN